MEKSNTKIKNKTLGNILANERVKYVIGTLLLAGVGITLPRIFHVLAGAGSGAMFLPMHIAALIAAMVFGVRSGIIVTIISTVMSYILTGMPSLERLPHMMVEITIYASLLGILSKKTNAYISLIATIILGRLMYAGYIFVIGNSMSVWDNFVTGLPGIAIQLLAVPFLVKIIKKGIKIDA